MSLFEQIGRHITDASQKSAQNTRAISQKMKINSAISDKERELAQLYISLGQDYYKRSKEDPAETAAAQIEEITRLLDEVQNSRDQIEQINETKNVFVPASAETDRKAGIIAVAVFSLAVLIVLIYLFGGRSCNATVEQYVDAQFGTDASKIIDLIPEDMLAYTLEEAGYDADELDEFMDEISEPLQAQHEQLNKALGEGWKYTYEILETEDVTGDALDDRMDFYEDLDIEVSKARRVQVQFTVKAAETEVSNTIVVSAIKVGRSWYLDIADMGGLF